MAELRTPEIEETLKKYPLYSQDGKGANAKVILKFFIGSYTFYITEGSDNGEGDITLFGLTVNGESAEFGYISLKELEEVEVKREIIDEPSGRTVGYIRAQVERDLYFTPTTLKEIAKTDTAVREHLLMMGYIK